MKQEYHMTGSGPAYMPPNMPEESQPLEPKVAETAPPESEVVETRFGKVTISRGNPINFPKGMLGIPERCNFCLAKMPSKKLERFKLLQSVDDLELSFITLPADIDNPIVERKDVLQACSDLKIPETNLVMLFVVSVHRRPGAVQLSVNARAPIFMDTKTRIATQYVFNTNKYAIQHMITM